MLKKNQPEVIAANRKTQSVDWEAFLAGIPGGKTLLEYGASRKIFRQGEPADAMYVLRSGRLEVLRELDYDEAAIAALRAKYVI